MLCYSLYEGIDWRKLTLYSKLRYQVFHWIFTIYYLAALIQRNLNPFTHRLSPLLLNLISLTFPFNFKRKLLLYLYDYQQTSGNSHQSTLMFLSVPFSSCSKKASSSVNDLSLLSLPMRCRLMLRWRCSVHRV